MPTPLLHDIRRLGPAGRSILFYSLFNVVSFQCLYGPAMVLFALKINMPMTQVGALLSYLPLSALVSLFMVQVVKRVGPKRMLVAAWLARSAWSCLIFLTPWALAQGGEKAAWAVLVATTVGFSILRALGVGAWFPWLHEVLPDNERAAYFSAEAIIVQLASVAAMVLQAFILGADPSIERFLIVYAVGIVTGFSATYWMARVPGGRGVATPLSVRETVAEYHIALKDRPFLIFTGIAAGCYITINAFAASIIQHLRSYLGLADNKVILIAALGGILVLVSLSYWGRFAEHAGSGRAMAKTLAGHALAALACLGITWLAAGQPGNASSFAVALLFALPVAVATYFRMAFYVVSHRAMLGYIQEAGRVAYGNIWTLGSMLAMGVTPIAVGAAIEHWEIGGYRASFAAASLGGLVLALAVRYGLHEDRPVRPSLTVLLNPAFPLRTLARIVWISAGLHESNRTAPENTARRS